ncbi:MAG: translation initiation factor IF-2 [Opitutales bacterium]
MSVRIHQLSKDIGMENKELIALLQERGFDVKSASNTIDNISADAIRDEFARKEEPAPEPEASQAAEPEAPAGEPEKPAQPKRPSGPFVKTREDLDREKAQKEADKKAAEEARSQAEQPAKPAPEAPKSQPAAPPRPQQPAPASPASPNRPAAPPPPVRRPAAPPPPGKPGTPPRPGAAPAPQPAAGEARPTPPETPSEDQEQDGSAAPAEPTPHQVIQVKPPIVVRDFAQQINRKPFQIISELMEMGIFASINQTIEEDVASRIAKNHGFTLEVRHRGEGSGEQKKKKEAEPVDESELLEPRPPVVCILGHVDHGKTTLLDTIRKANVVEDEAGGITQHIGAYQVVQNDKPITFIDTPGHAAFSKMRERGANTTDIAVLVVAADDGFMPQTDEALKFAKAAQNSIIVAINKMDAPGANADRVRTQMQERGIPPEDWGGEVITCELSALRGEGIDNLLEMINLQAEIMELKAVPTGQSSGVVIESLIEQGRGPVASVIVERGILKTGDSIVCGSCSCKVRSLIDDQGQTLKSAGPATPVKVVGWSDTPPSGLKYETVKNDREARRLVEERIHEAKLEAAAVTQQSETGASVEDLFAAFEQQAKSTLRVILRADVHGSLEALATSLEEIPTDKVDLEIINKGVGMITKNDVILASTGEATIVGFNTRLENGVQGLAKHHQVDIFQHNIIYEVIDLVRDAMADRLEPELREKKTGRAEVRQVFPLGKRIRVAGCMVTEGSIRRDLMARVVRKDERVHQSKIATLRRFKDDVTEVRAGYECGVRIDGCDAYEEGDIIECFQVEKIRPSL